MDSGIASIAFSTGMTCIPIPSPPGLTMDVIFSSGKNVILSKKEVTAGFLAIRSWEELNNSALPGTK